MRPVRRGAVSQSALYRLLLPLGHQLMQMPNKPPVTIALAGLMVAIHLELPGFDFVPSIRRACLQPALILEKGQWGRLLWSALLHGDDMHLFLNMSSFLWKGALLEPALGPVRFARLLLELLALSHGTVVLLSRTIAALVPSLRGMYYRECAVGFSAVLFALKVVLNADAPTHSIVYGFTVPTKYVCWVELLIIQALTPNASLLGHVSGILAGLVHVYLLAGPLDRRRGGAAGRLRRSWLGRRLLALRNWRRPYSGRPRFTAAASTSAAGPDPASNPQTLAGPGSRPALSQEAVRLQRQLYFERGRGR